MGQTESKVFNGAVALPNTAVEKDEENGILGSTPIYRCGDSPDALLDHFFPGIETIADNFFERGLKNHPERPCLGWREVTVIGPVSQPPQVEQKIEEKEEENEQDEEKEKEKEKEEEGEGEEEKDKDEEKDAEDEEKEEDEDEEKEPAVAASSSSSAASSSTKPAVETKVGGYKWLSYAEVGTKVLNFASGLRCRGLEKGAHVGVYSKNCPEWMIADLAAYAQSMAIVALYDTFGQEAIEYIIEQAELSLVVCSQDKIENLLNAKQSCPTLKTIVQIEPEGDEALVSRAKELGIDLVTFAMLEAEGALTPHEREQVTADDLATIMYTSGTTGLPKGVLLTHRCIMSGLAGGLHRGIDVNETDVHISYLPLSHIFEKLVCYMILSQGGAIGYFQGDTRKLFDDIEVLRPTIFPSVPRLFQRLYDKVTQSVSSGGVIKRSLFNWAFDSKVDTLEAGGSQSSVWDAIVFKALRAKLGGRVRYIITGSAPISSELFRFLQVCFSCYVIQGYGLTESSAAATITVPGDTSIGHVGPPLACTEIKLQDVPEMEYFSTDEPQPRGEVCLRGPNIFHGYYKNPEKTKEAIDEDGWFHTGDVGTMTAEGNLKIIDRKKNCCKLSIGEYVALEYLESIFLKNKYVAMMYLHADSLQNCLIAIIVPDPDVVLPWARENNIPHADNLDAVCREPATVEHILASIQETGRAKNIKSFEHVRAIHLEPEPFSVESNLLTPTFKNKRPQLVEHYKDILEDLYASLN